MNDILTFGTRNTIGEELIRLIKETNSNLRTFSYSKSLRKKNKVDFLDESTFKNIQISENAIWINFGPIWDFSKFLKDICKSRPELLIGLKAIISCSSTSVSTKKFTINKFDKNLVRKITNAETQIIKICKKNNVISKIIRTTLIYGKTENYKDKNLSKIVNIMEIFPIIFIPNNSGLRQPIHYSQVANITFNLIEKIVNLKISKSNIIEVGGDEEITYFEMVNLIRESLPINHKAKKCRIVKIPQSLFIFLCLPLIFISLKSFEAILRINANLAGFTPSNKLLKTTSKKFPLNL